MGRIGRRKDRIWFTEAAAPIESPSDSSEQPVEYNGITLIQLCVVMANIRRRCVVEGWVNNNNEPLTAETVTLYEVVKYLILRIRLIQRNLLSGLSHSGHFQIISSSIKTTK